MSFPYTPNLQDEKLESLQTQYEFLNILRLRHLHWMNEATDPETGRVHHEIAELIEQLTDHYNSLLTALQAKRDELRGKGDGDSG
jgi:uncharacterized coiled-coil DUF342 family protein